MEELNSDGLPILKGNKNVTADGLPILKKKAQPVDLATGGVGSVPGLEAFQQFKPGVNKYVRQPAPVAPGIRNQGQAPKTVAQAQKEKPVPFSQEAFKQAAPQGISPSTANRMGAITSTASGFYRIPELIYSTFAAPQNLAADILDKPELRANYDAISKGTYNPLGVIDKTADYLQQSSVDWEKNKTKYNENITTQLMNGDFQGAARQIGDQIESSIPGMLSMYVTGPLAAAGKFAPTARTLTMAAPFAGSQLNEIKDNPNIPDYLKPINAWLNGTAEVVLEEQFGTKALVDDMLRVARTEGREAAVNTIKNVLRPLGERFIKKVQPVTNVLGNGLEEGITTFSQNVVDKYTGVDPNRGLLDNVPDSIIVGTAQGTGVTALSKGMDVLTNPKNQVKIDTLSKQRDDLMNDLDSPSIPDNIKGDLVDKLTDINEEINIVLDENRAEYDALSDDDIGTLKTLNDQIDDRVDLLNNTSLSETSRQLAQNDLAALQKDLAAKQKEVSSKVEQFKTQTNAVQKPSTTSQVPPVIKGGQNIQEGGEGVGQGVEGTQAPQEAPIQEPTAEIKPEEKVTKRGVEIELPSELKVTEVKPYTEVEQNYYRPDQQLKFNQGTYEPVRIIANPDVIKAISIGSKLSDFSGKGKGKNVSEQDMLFAQDIAKKLGYVSGDGTGSSILLNKAVKELAKQNRNKNQEVFIILGKEKTPIDIKAPQEKIISPENSSNYANLTEDDKGNFVFYHFSNQKLNEVNPSKYGSNPERVTSPEEATAMGKVGGMSNFYPNLNFRERQVSGKYGYEVKIPKEKVYDFNTDVNNYIKEAKDRFEKENPNAAFTPNNQLAYVTKIAEENGYDMVVAEWADGRTRANSTKNLKVTDFSESDGNKVKKAFKNQYQSNLDKGFETVRPESKDKVLQSVYDDIYKERNSQERYDDLYRLYSESNKYTQDEITELINNSDISDKLKAKYNDAVNYKEPSKSSKLKIKEVVQPKSEEQAAIHRETGGSTFTVDGTNRNGTKAASVSIFPERTKIVEGELTKEDIDGYVKDNSDIYSGNEDVLAVGTWLDGKTGETYLDVSVVLPKKEAKRLGKDYNQIAIWDLEKGKEIPTGGTGEAIEGLKPEIDRVSDIRNILGPQKALKQAEVKVEETQDLASKIRSLKINLGKGTAQSNIAGLPIALYNSAIETIALGLEAGASLTEAINNAIEKHKLSKVKEFDKNAFISEIENATGEKVKKETSIINAEVEAKRAEYGFEEPSKRPYQSNKTTLDKAKQAIKDGVSVNDVIEKALNREPITEVESAMISLYQGTKEAELIKANTEIEQMKSSSALDFTEAVDKRNKIIDDLVNAYNAGEVSGNVSARALQARKIKVLQDDSLANMLIQKRKANNNRKLTNKQVEEITQLYTKMKATKALLEIKIEKLNEENAKLKLKNAAPKIIKEVKAESTGKTKEQLKAEREDIFKQMSELARKSRANLSMNPIPAEMIPLVVKLAKNYLATGAKTLDEVIDKVQADLSGYIENVSKNDIRRTLADYDADTRPTKEDIQDEVFGERSKEKQIKDIEDLEEQARKEKDLEAAQLLQDEANAKRTAMEKQAEKDGLDKEQSRLDNYKKNIQKRIDELQGKLKKGDYSKTPKNEIKLDDEARKLKKQLEDIKFEFAVELEKDALASRNKVQKFTDGLIEFFNLPRSLMATADFSAPLRQAAVVTVAYPDIAAKAAIEMGVQWASSEKAEQWMDDLMESPGYKLMKDSGLYIANIRSAKLSAKEEDFSTNLAGKIPVAGALVNASERAYVAYLNKMRVDIFNRGVELLQNDGYSFATNPKAYKTLANYVNAATGRGSLGGGALEKAGPALNALMFSPRLLASRVRLLTMLADPRMYKKENRTVRNMYLKDMSSFVGFGLAVLALAAAAGAEVEDDPRSTDFGKIKVGDTRWDIWGGFQQPIRAFVQATTEERKSTTTGKIVKLDGSGYGGETGGDVILRFFRGKLAPVPAFLVNAYTGKDVMGRPFELGPAVLQMSYPLVIQSVIESAKKDGVVFGVLATGVPSLLGVGVQTYGANDFLKQGVDDKSINLLLSKKAIAIEPNELDTKVFDVNTGEDRKMSDEEFKKYYADWADYIKMKLRDNYDEYKDMSVDEFETEFRSIKSEATKLAKEDISGVSNTTKTISYREDDESESYKLTPEELKYRQSLNEQYISRHGNIYNKEFKNAIRNGKSEEEADIIAKKRLTSKANEYSRKIILKQHKSGRGYDF